jgi:hypothetical protein
MRGLGSFGAGSSSFKGDVRASMDERRCEALGSFSRPAARPTSQRTEKSLIPDDDGLPSFRKILARPKQVIDLTHDDDDITEVSWLRNT